MKNILITAGGTATAWHLATIIKKHFPTHARLFIADINPPHLIAAATLADTYLQVPPIKDPTYYPHLLKLIQTHHLDVIIPLIDTDLSLLAQDNPDLIALGATSTAPDKTTMSTFLDKKLYTHFLTQNNFPTPKIYDPAFLPPSKSVFLKPRIGNGSRDSQIITPSSLKQKGELDDFIIEELCSPPEITAEIFHYRNQTHFILRERLEVKAGVCTKARFFTEPKIASVITRLTKKIKFPVASCIQFMRNQKNKWCITDINLRLGAGTALSTSVGFQLARASLSVWLNEKTPYQTLLTPPQPETYAVRVYQEIPMKKL